MLFEDKPRAVVGGKDNKCIFRQAFAAQRPEYLPDAPVNLFNYIAIQTAQAFVLELLRDKQRNVRQVVRQVEKEGLIFAFSYKLDCLFGIALYDGVLVGGALYNLFIAHKRDIEVLGLRLKERLSSLSPDAVHIVAVWNAEIGIEAVICRQILPQVSEVPFSDTGGRVTFGLEGLGDCNFTFRQAAC